MIEMKETTSTISGETNEEIYGEEITTEETTTTANMNNNITQPQNKDELIGTWRYTNDGISTTYVFKQDGTLWIDGTYIDKYNSDKKPICDHCLGYGGTAIINYGLKDGFLYINFYKELYTYTLVNTPTTTSKYVTTTRPTRTTSPTQSRIIITTTESITQTTTRPTTTTQSTKPKETRTGTRYTLGGFVKATRVK